MEKSKQCPWCDQGFLISAPPEPLITLTMAQHAAYLKSRHFYEDRSVPVLPKNICVACNTEQKESIREHKEQDNLIFQVPHEEPFFVRLYKNSIRKLKRRIR